MNFHSYFIGRNYRSSNTRMHSINTYVMMFTYPPLRKHRCKSTGEFLPTATSLFPSLRAQTREDRIQQLIGTLQSNKYPKQQDLVISSTPHRHACIAHHFYGILFQHLSYQGVSYAHNVGVFTHSAPSCASY